MFNSLKYAKILEGAGLPRHQAEIHVQILTDVIGEEMATKNDLKLLATKNGLQKLESKVDSLEQRLTYELQSLEHRLIFKLGGLVAGLLAVSLTVVKLFLV